MSSCQLDNWLQGSQSVRGLKNIWMSPFLAMNCDTPNRKLPFRFLDLWNLPKPNIDAYFEICRVQRCRPYKGIPQSYHHHRHHYQQRCPYKRFPIITIVTITIVPFYLIREPDDNSWLMATCSPWQWRLSVHLIGNAAYRHCHHSHYPAKLEICDVLYFL